MKENYSRAKTIDSNAALISSGIMEFSELRGKLESLELDKEEITLVVDLVNKKVLQNAKFKEDHARGKNLFIGGLSLAALSILVGLLSYTGILDLEGRTLLMFGPILGGIFLALRGKSLMNKA